MRKLYISALVVAALVAPLTVTANASEQAGYICVNTNNVYYRTGPGTGYTAWGQVNKGQGLTKTSDAPANRPADGSWWVQGNLWGGRAGVWIQSPYLSWCS
jgi:uncharacterized protein YgiM (DUF1202 family)